MDAYTPHSQTNIHPSSKLTNIVIVSHLVNERNNPNSAQGSLLLIKRTILRAVHSNSHSEYDDVTVG